MLSRSGEVVSKDGGERRLLHGQKLNTRITYREVPGNSKTSTKTETTLTALKSPVPLPPSTPPKIFDGGRGRGRGTDIQGLKKRIKAISASFIPQKMNPLYLSLSPLRNRRNWTQSILQKKRTSSTRSGLFGGGAKLHASPARPIWP
jgi:hypothetical protein